ncbi:MAG: FliA/WhiG family RNA polymerase sigma factor [Deltaproteobacteria bacterium]|nr:FliA/WhiG family RNA polymerase sigma factor [Deltaproteobacteria bacterium]
MSTAAPKPDQDEELQEHPITGLPDLPSTQTPDESDELRESASPPPTATGNKVAKPNPYAKKTPHEREAQVLEHTPLIKRIVTRMAARFPPGVNLEDLYQAGMIGLLDAVDKFDASKDVQFKTYAEFRIKGAVLDELRSMDWVPRSVRAAASDWETAWRTKASEVGREPNDSEMAEQMGLSLKEYHDFLIKSRPIPLLSIEEFNQRTSDEEQANLLDVFTDPTGKDPFQVLSLQQMQGKLAATIKELSEQEQMVLSLYYNEELNLKEVGEVLHVVESRVSQIRTKAILKLRAKLRGVILNEGKG